MRRMPWSWRLLAPSTSRMLIFYIKAPLSPKARHCSTTAPWEGEVGPEEYPRKPLTDDRDSPAGWRSLRCSQWGLWKCFVKVGNGISQKEAGLTAQSCLHPGHASSLFPGQVICWGFTVCIPVNASSAPRARWWLFIRNGLCQGFSNKNKDSM